jgi:hypothetical protein
MWATISAIWTWLQAHEQSLAIWLEGFALVAIFFLELKEYKRQGVDRIAQHKESADQMEIMRIQARATETAARAAQESVEAFKNSERAWIIAELIPTATLASDKRWYRYLPDGRPVLMSLEETLAGIHLRHKLRITNMGRTPAIIAKYEINCRRPQQSPDDIELLTFDLPYRLLAGGATIDSQDAIIDVFEYTKSSKGFVFFDGIVTYYHAFSRSDNLKEAFVYLFDDENNRLKDIRFPPAEEHPKESKAEKEAD